MKQILETKRLLLRQWRDEDFAPFAALNADPEVMRYFPAPLSREASDAMALRCRSLIFERGWGFWAVERKDTQEFIGFVGLNKPVAQLPFSPCVEIGWRLALAHWGNGYATEAAQRALQFGFEELELPEIVSFCVLSNSKSRAVMERLGMQDQGATFNHPAIPVEHELSLHCLYRLSRDRWQSISRP
jgi:RimJ/RimL family protein N-acetyltransferase